MEEDNNPIQEMGKKNDTNLDEINENVKQINQKIPKKVNGACLASFILSLVGLFIFGIPCGIAALISGIKGIEKFNKDIEKFKWMGIVGIVIGVADVVLIIIFQAIRVLLS